MKILIIGGVAGGATAAARIRRLDEKAEIIMFERGEHISFANCGLPYYIGGIIKEKSALTLQTPKSFNDRFNVDVRNNSQVLSIDRDKKTITVKNGDKTYDESYDKLILSMGAKPIDIGLENVFTLRNIPDTYKIDEYIKTKKPKSAVVIGGGYIGIEMAENLAHLGISISVIELAPHIIAPLDLDTALEVQHYMKSIGINLILSKSVDTVTVNEDGSLSINNGFINTDMIISSVGVTPESEIAKNCGIVVNARGAIIVDEHMLTSDKDIYAVGDVTETHEFVTGSKAFIPLAGPANKQGRIVADNICSIKSTYKGTQGSSILKVGEMTVATTGINERTCKTLKINYEKVHTYSASHAGYYPGGEFMSIKTIFAKDTGRILGAQIIGFDGVDKRCDVLAVAIRAKMTYKDLTELELCYAPPYSSAKDPVNMVGYVIENIISGKVSIAHWDDMENFIKDATLLDVRTVGEFKEGNINGFINIPLDELRGNIAKLDKTKPVYVHCHSGMRSYIACRILSAVGFKCYNISGGYRLYSLMN